MIELLYALKMIALGASFYCFEPDEEGMAFHIVRLGPVIAGFVTRGSYAGDPEVSRLLDNAPSEDLAPISAQRPGCKCPPFSVCNNCALCVTCGG